MLFSTTQDELIKINLFLLKQIYEKLHNLNSLTFNKTKVQNYAVSILEQN